MAELPHETIERFRKAEYKIGYQQGKADAEAEHKEMCETCIHKVSAEDIKQIRAEVIEEVNEIMNMDAPISNVLYEIDKWLKEQMQKGAE